MVVSLKPNVKRQKAKVKTQNSKVKIQKSKVKIQTHLLMVNRESEIVNELISQPVIASDAKQIQRITRRPCERSEAN
jgi:hypothetical protein